MSRDAANRLDVASEVVFLALVVGTPLAFGSVEVWAIESMKAGILLLVLLRMAARRANGHRAVSGRTLAAGGILLPALLFLAFVVLQAVPLPSSAIRLLAPATDALYRETVPGYPSTTGAAPLEPWVLGESAPPAGAAIPDEAPFRAFRTLSLVPAATLERLGLLLAFLALFFAAHDLARDERRRVRMLLGISVTGLAVGAFALLQALTWNGRIYWVRELTQGGDPFGPFVNSNHFAGYMELVLPVTLGLLLLIWEDRERRPAPRGEPQPAAAGVVRFARRDEGQLRMFAGWGEAAVPKTVFVSCALAVGVFAIFASGSRAGLLATLLTVLLFAGVIVPPTLRRRGLLLTALVAACLVSGVLLARSGVLFSAAAAAEASEPSFAGRWINWTAMRPLIESHLAVGTGLGTFQRAYAGFYPAGVINIWKQAHNDYLQVVIEAGLAGAALLLWMAFRFFRRVRLASGEEVEYGPLRTGILMALVSIAIHSLVDFNLQIPANGFLIAALCGILVTFAPPPARREPAGRPGNSAVALRRAAGAGVILLAAYCAYGSVRRFLGDRFSGSGEAALSRVDPGRARADFDRAAALDPSRVETFLRIGQVLLEEEESRQAEPGPAGTAPPEDLVRRAEEAYRRALDLAPTEAAAWSGLSDCAWVRAQRSYREAGLQLSEIGRAGVSREALDRAREDTRDERLAIALLDKSVRLEPNGFEYLDERADRLLEAGEVQKATDDLRRSAAILPVPALHLWARPESMPPAMAAAIEAGLEEAARGNPFFRESVALRGLAEIQALRGENAAAVLSLKRALDASGDPGESGVLKAELGMTYERMGEFDAAFAALGEATGTPSVAAVARLHRGEILWRLKRQEEAYHELRAGAAAFPRNRELRLSLSGVAAGTGRTELAVQLLETLAAESPTDPEPLRRLVAIHRLTGDRVRALAAARRLVSRSTSPADQALLDELRSPSATVG